MEREGACPQPVKVDPRQIYTQIPTERYCNGCHECATRCSGDIALAQAEWDAIRQWVEAHLPPAEIGRLMVEDKTMELGDGIRERFCLFYDMRSRRCAIYPVRPMVCRLLGFVPWLPCPIGRVDAVLPGAADWISVYSKSGLRRMSEWLQACPFGANDK